MSSLLALVFQAETTGSETTGLAKQAVNASQSTIEKAGEGLSGVSALFSNVVAYLASSEFIGNVVATVIVVILAIIFYRVAVRLVPRTLL